MSSEVGGLVTKNTVGVASIAGMQSEPEKYVNWFDVVHDFYGKAYTYSDLADVVSFLVAVFVILSTVKALFGVKAMKITLMAISALCVTILLTGCVTPALKFPEKTGFANGSCATVGGAARLFAGNGQTGSVTQHGDGETKSIIVIKDESCSVTSITTRGDQAEIEALEKAAESEGS